MKKINLVFAALVLSLVACGKSDNSSTSDNLSAGASVTTGTSVTPGTSVTTGTSLSESTSIIPVNRITDWTSDTKTLLEEFVGELIPVAPLSTDYFTQESDDGYGLWIVDMVGGDTCNQYASILENAGYTYDAAISSSESIEYYFKDSAVEEDTILEVYFYYENNEMAIYVGLFSSYSGEYITDWSEEVKELMLTHLGEVIPVAPFAENHFYEYDADEDLIYMYDEEVGDVTEIYAEILEDENYIYDEEVSGIDDYGDFVYVFYKETAEGEICIELYFYTEYASSEIIAYFLPEGGTIIPPGPIDGDSITLTNTDFSSTDYASNNKSHTFGSLIVTTSNVMSYGGTIQFRNNNSGHGTMANTTALAIQSITLTLTATASSVIGTLDNVVVSAGTSATQLTAITGNNGVYNLNGATFFSITTINTGVINFSSMVFTLSE